MKITLALLAALFAHSAQAAEISFAKDVRLLFPTERVISEERWDGHYSRSSCSNPVVFSSGRTTQFDFTMSNECQVARTLDTETGSLATEPKNRENCDLTWEGFGKYPAKIEKGAAVEVDTARTYRLTGAQFGTVIWYLRMNGGSFYPSALRCTYELKNPLTAERVLEISGGYISISPEAL